MPSSARADSVYFSSSLSNRSNTITIRSHEPEAGTQFILSPISNTSTPASVDVCDVASHVLLKHVIGQSVCDPSTQCNDSNAERQSLRSPAELAS